MQTKEHENFSRFKVRAKPTCQVELKITNTMSGSNLRSQRNSVVREAMILPQGSFITYSEGVDTRNNTQLCMTGLSL